MLKKAGGAATAVGSSGDVGTAGSTAGDGGGGATSNSGDDGSDQVTTMTTSQQLRVTRDKLTRAEMALEVSAACAISCTPTSQMHQPTSNVCLFVATFFASVLNSVLSSVLPSAFHACRSHEESAID